MQHAITTAAEARALLQRAADPARAAVLRGFFKTGPGSYGEGDRFIGVTVPRARRIAAECRHLAESHLEHLMHSPVHEERLLALLVLVDRYRRGTESDRRAVYRFTCEHLAGVNSWDLVDLTAPAIVGQHLLHRRRTPLDRLAAGNSLWERRIAVVATLTFIRHGQFEDTLRIADRLLNDPEDLIHKAVGWMLREVGKRDRAVEERFLRPRCRRMPRTMLRYAIERFPEAHRQRYLNPDA